MLNTFKRTYVTKKIVAGVQLQISLMLIILFFSQLTPVAQAGETQTAKDAVHLIETDEANCIVNDGKLISLMLVDKTMSVEVWVDRWFMSVQTADHTKQHLSAETPIAELGCSKTNSGPQHWTIHSVKPI